ncbi:MAG: HNH endonuclease [Candidatus Acidiferrales bacterium]
MERDGWRCQSCGRMEGLQVHHIRWRSRLGGDEKENLITLCSDCHQSSHGARLKGVGESASHRTRAPTSEEPTFCPLESLRTLEQKV